MAFSRYGFVTMAVVTMSCGGAAHEEAEPDQVGASYAALCAGAPERHGDLVTVVGCAFEQQVRNMMVYGDTLEPQTLVDGAGEPLATVTQSCDSWWLGSDANGLGVLLDSESGRILSHGMLHAGQATSLLPEDLPTPFTLR